MIVVTTPTGDIGSQVVQGLLDRGAPVRVIVRDASRLPSDVRARVEVVEGSHHDADVVTAAFECVDAVFWLVPPDYRTEHVASSYVDFSRPACEAFVSQGVQRVVPVSVLGHGSTLAGNAGVVTASLAMHDLIASTGVAYRALALPSFMSNLLTQVEAIRSQGAIFGVLPDDVKLPAIATRDIASAAIELVLDESWSGQQDVPLLGAEDLSYSDMAGIVSEVLERPVRYQQVPNDAFKANLVTHGMSEAMAQGLIDMNQAKSQGLDSTEPRTSDNTTPTTFRQWCQDVLQPAFDRPV